MNTQQSRAEAPQNLLKLIQGDQNGYVIKTGYSLQLEHSLMGYFPAICRDTQNVVVTFDLKLIEDVWHSLSPRQSQLNKTKFYVNKRAGICFPITGTSDYDMERSEAIYFLTRERFEELMAEQESPFSWAPGLFSDEMSLEEFRETIEAAMD